MKVYTHYCEDEKTKIQYRWRTLLQFGNSWNIIGSIVMKNPGSSKMISDNIINDSGLLEHLKEFDDKVTNPVPWYSFSIDNTMGCVKNLFKEYKLNNDEGKNLNGVIQVFNLFNIRDADLSNACNKLSQSGNDNLYTQTTDYDIEHLVAPIYLGWGGLGKESKHRDAAIRIFKTAIDKCNQKYLDENFDKNKFYHPQYLMMYGRNNGYVKKLKACFYQNTKTPSGDFSSIQLIKVDSKEVVSKIKERLSSNGIEEYEKNRYKLAIGLQFTITPSNNGYIGIRSIDHKGGKIYTDAYSYSYKEQILEILCQHRFSKNDNAWIGVKNFNEYEGDNAAEKAKEILDEIKSIKTALLKLE